MTKVYIVERRASDGWSCTGVATTRICSVFPTREEAEAYIAKQPKDDSNGTGWHRFDYDYFIIEGEMGADLTGDDE